jgi:hypothetical protein
VHLAVGLPLRADRRRQVEAVADLAAQRVVDRLDLVAQGLELRRRLGADSLELCLVNL